MRSTRQLSITLPNEMAEMVRAKVESGEYASESETPDNRPRPPGDHEPAYLLDSHSSCRIFPLHDAHWKREEEKRWNWTPASESPARPEAVYPGGK